MPDVEQWEASRNRDPTACNLICPIHFCCGTAPGLQKRKFSEMKSNLKRKGNIIEDMDILIAAMALSHNLILVTNNVRHFEKVKDLRLENWKG